ncbi:homeobox protein pnx-like [Aphis craccivora]|uniref:Homeobox protein pnx-like n=1 Tax=Aphis craccivora TaxID=307492 RepID=A0A6G0Z2T2_APHCR|nr:homeobox protein pnx-like [Aphis craccivora]
MKSLEPLYTTTSLHVNNALSVESGFMENNWQDNQKIQMQNQVNIWNSMMYRYWKLQRQQHLIPYYRNAWHRRMSYEVSPASHSDTNDAQASQTNIVQSHTLDPSNMFATTLKSTKESLNTKNPKRIRASFTEEQIRILENAFLSNSCLSPGNRRYLAKQLGLSERRVNVWFQNRRVKKYGNSRMDYWSKTSNKT